MMKHKTQIVKCMNANATIICNLNSVFTVPHNKAITFIGFSDKPVT